MCHYKGFSGGLYIKDSKWVVACFGGISDITDCIAWSYISYGEIVSPE